MALKMEKVRPVAEAYPISSHQLSSRYRAHPSRKSSISLFKYTEEREGQSLSHGARQPREARNLMCRSIVMLNTVITSRNVAIGSRDTRPVQIANGGSVHHTAGQASETFSQAISRCSVTPSTTRGGGIRIISPFSNRTPRGCFVPIRPGSGAASTVVTSCLPSYV